MRGLSTVFWLSMLLGFASSSPALDTRPLRISDLGKIMVVCQSAPAPPEAVMADPEPEILEEKRAPINHQIVARLMGRAKNEERRMLHDPKMFFTDDSDVDNTHTSMVGPSYDVTTSSPDYLPTTYITRPYTTSRRSAQSQFIDTKDAIQEYGRVIKKRGRRHGSNTGFLYEPHLFGHDVLFPAPIHSIPIIRKPSKAENGPNRETTAASTGVSGPELVLPGKFRIMK